MNIIIIAFNYGLAGNVVNGPGISLINFHKILKANNNSVNIYTECLTNASDVSHISKINTKILQKADMIIYWSGLSEKIINLLGDLFNQRIFLGPNLIDTVFQQKEEYCLQNINFEKILTVNLHLKYLIAKVHKLSADKIDILMVGPDLNLWKPSNDKDDTILWKGNSKHFVKDVKFGLEVAKALKMKYKFKFIGYPETYSYLEHITEAKKSKLYISTSLSETMGNTTIEGWASGLPSITHPKIYLHGINYQTGIITNKTIDCYVGAIDEIMQNEQLYKHLQINAISYCTNNFSDKYIINRFLEIIK